MIGSKTAFQNYPLARLGITMTRIREVEVIDAMGGVISSTNSELEVTLILANLTKKDLKNDTFGQAVKGNMKIYFDYDQDIIEGDTLQDSNGILWHVEMITAEYPEVYKIAIIKNISLKGS
jgi:hypothetical protein